VFVVAAFTLTYRLPTSNLNADELTYAAAAREYAHGSYTSNLEHPFVAKYIFGFAQLVLGDGIEAMRITAVASTLIAGMILYAWIASAAGRLPAVAAMAFWLLAPRLLYPEMGPRVDRYGILEPILCLFTIIAMAIGWKWAQTGRWSWMALAGLASGLTVGVKLSGAVVVVGTILFVFMRRRIRAMVQIVSYGAISVVAFLATYAPMGNPIPALKFMLTFQSQHAQNGHLVDVAGVAYQFPPPWALLWFLYYGLGLAASIGFGVAACLCLALIFTRFVRYRPGGRHLATAKGALGGGVEE
jgi:4-amino-4-deoxy-L-arabinose transferase-like glycosyltransferase